MFFPLDLSATLTFHCKMDGDRVRLTIKKYKKIKVNSPDIISFVSDILGGTPTTKRTLQVCHGSISPLGNITHLVVGFRRG
jgi:hypothetical protein